MRAFLAAVLLVAAAALAGCLQGSGPDAADPAATPEVRTGTIEGRVTDDEMFPLPGAQVSLIGTDRAVLTDADGGFRIDQVPAGQAVLRAELDRYVTAESQAAVPADGVAEVQIALRLEPGFAPANLTLIFNGHYDCAHEIPIWTGDCGILWENVTGSPFPLFSQTYAFPVEVGPRWASVVMEITWEGSANNQLEGMRLYLEHGNASTTGHSVKVGRADGAQMPLAFVVHQGEPHERADVYPGTDTKAMLPAEGETAQVRAFPRGMFHDTTSQVCDGDGRCLLGVGAGLDIRFTIYATVFYNERAPEGFTAVPEA